MEKLFASYDLAEKARDKEFDEPCLTFYFKDKNIKGNVEISFVNGHQNHFLEDGRIAAPIYQQLIDWLESKSIYLTFSSEPALYGKINYISQVYFKKNGICNYLEENESLVKMDVINKAINQGLDLIKL